VVVAEHAVDDVQTPIPYADRAPLTILVTSCALRV
jgi:hypothetical protein